MSAITSGPRGPLSERQRGVSSTFEGGSISLGRAGLLDTREGEASEGCPSPRTRFLKRSVASESAKGGDGIVATSPIVGVGGCAGKTVLPPLSRTLGRRAERVGLSSTPTPYPGLPFDLSLARAGVLGGRCSGRVNRACTGDWRAGVDGAVSHRLGWEPLSPTKGEAGGVARTRSAQLPEPGRNMFLRLGRRFFVAANSFRGLRLPDAALRCVWYSPPGTLVVGGEEGGEAYFSTAWRLIGAGLLRGGFALGALVGVALFEGLLGFLRLRRNSRRPAKPVFFGCASTAAVFGDGYPGEGKMYVPSGDGVPCVPRGATSVLGGVGRGGGTVETGTAGIDMCFALRVVMLDAWR